MRTLKLFAMILLIGIIAVSCKKETGPTGPQGPSGTNGTNGTNGNANVTVYGFGSTTLNSGNGYYGYFYPAGLTSGMIDSSTVVSYYQVGANEWNMANGLGPAANYATIQYTYGGGSPFVSIYLRNADGTTYTGSDVTWDSVRIFVVPANIYKIANRNNLDYKNYKAVNNYFKTK